MSKRIYTEDEIKALLVNPNVVRCSNKAITYNKDFKIRAVKEYYELGRGPNAIFQKAGFDLDVLGRDKPRTCLKMWRKIYKIKGPDELLKESRGQNGGRKPKTAESTDLEYLQTKIAYLEAENAFLKNLKTKRKT